MTAGLATPPREAIGQNAGLQEAAQLPLSIGRDTVLLPVVVAQNKESLEMILHRAVEACIGGTSPAVGGRRASLRPDGHVRVPAPVDRL